MYAVRFNGAMHVLVQVYFIIVARIRELMSSAHTCKHDRAHLHRTQKMSHEVEDDGGGDGDSDGTNNKQKHLSKHFLRFGKRKISFCPKPKHIQHTPTHTCISMACNTEWNAQFLQVKKIMSNQSMVLLDFFQLKKIIHMIFLPTSIRKFPAHAKRKVHV